MSAAGGTVRCPLLIGRDDLLELVDRRLDDALACRGQFLLVAGEAGIGKSRFLDAIGQKSEERGFVQAWGALAPQDRNMPAASIMDLARTMARMPAFATAGQQLLALREATLVASQVHRRELVMDAVTIILDATDGPALFGFEDLQWADDLSLEIIAEVARRARDRRVLLCGAYRTDEAPSGTGLRDWRSRLLTQRFAEEIRLQPLDEAQTALVTTLVLDTGLPAPRDVVAAVYDRTDGIPLHIEELLGALSADARANGYAIREATVPETIEDAVIARLSHRSLEAQAVARAGAVIGRCFVPDVLAGIMDVQPDSVDGPLQELIDHGVLWPPGDRGLYDFRHQLLRDAIYRSVPTGDRRRIHARAGEFGASLEGQSEIHSSLHFERAGDRRRAYETALAGARDAARLSAHREAYELYRRAVANLPNDLAPLDRAQILEAAANEAGAIEEHEATEALATEAVATYRQAGEPVKAMLASFILHAIWRRDVRPVSQRLAALDAIALEVDGLPVSNETETVHGEIAFMRALALADRRSMPEARQALAEVRRLGDHLGDAEYIELADWKGTAFDILEGDVTNGLARLRSLAEAAERDGREMNGVDGYRDGGMLAMFAMEYPTASRMLASGMRYADAIEQSHCAHVMAATTAMVAWADGRWAEASGGAGQALADRGCRRAAEIARWALGYAAMGRGDVTEATEALTAGWRFGVESESIELILPPLWGLAELALQEGAADVAIARCTDAQERATAVGERLLFVPFVVTGTRANLAAGRPADAATWVEACAAHLAAVRSVAGPALDHARGLLELAEGATGLARTSLEAAVAGWDAKGRIWEATWARLDLAQCLIRSNRFADAVPLTIEARSTAARLDSPPLAERADTLQRMARGHVSIEEPWRPLTSREFAVARLIGEGMTNGEIAEALGIAPKTASSHVEHILAKLGASRRAEIATWASHVEGVASAS